ncbi:MAG TPA: hypothetical protein VFB81_19700 [Myxococcales bacterium]|nr:hypothetical protein [Myxococcales bacterium]
MRPVRAPGPAAAVPAALAALVAALAGAGCVSIPDDPTTVHDLRVLGISMEPPELMAPVCPSLSGGQITIPEEDLATYAAQVTLRALLVDPAGNGRPISYELFACSSLGDRTCEKETETVLIASGQTTAGAFTHTFRPGTILLPNGQPLLFQVLQNDTVYHGLGGIRVPLVLHVGAQGEEIFAQKIMLYSCQFFPDQQANVTPALPGMNMNGNPWPEEPEVLQLTGRGPFRTLPDDMAALQEPYVVPSIPDQNGTVTRIDLVESWKLSWYTDYGTFSSATTGGTDASGRESRHNDEWRLPANAEERDVTYWVVVRDGRGGLSWKTWRAHYTP